MTVVPFVEDTADSSHNVWTNMPSALTELPNFSGGAATAAVNERKLYDFTGATQARMVANVSVAGSGGGTPSRLQGQFSTNSGTTWTNLDGTAASGDGGPFVNVNATGPVAGSYATLTGVREGRRDAADGRSARRRRDRSELRSDRDCRSSRRAAPPKSRTPRQQPGRS